MNSPTEPTPAPAPAGVSKTTLTLAVLLAGATGAAAVLAVVHFGQPKPAAVGPAGAGGGNATAADSAFPQNGTVKLTELGGVVYYPVPYMTPPHLTVECPRRHITITKQDEQGFSWSADTVAEQVKAEAVELTGKGPAKGQPDEFTWEAKGVRGGPGVLPTKLFEQTGKFQSVFGTQGEIYFPVPYAVPLNVELSGTYSETTVVTEVKAVA